MEAKDTIMGNLAQAIIAHPDLPMGQAIAIEQAEISFKAGQKEGRKGMFLAGDYNGYLRGIKEVVEWVNKRVDWKFAINKEIGGHISFNIAQWQAQLKEWGVK